MNRLMRCLYCGLLQDEPAGVKACRRCGGELAFEQPPPPDRLGSYLDAQMELDQVKAPAGKTVDRYLLVTLRTPQSVPPEHAVAAGPSRPAVHFTAVLDVSGSMRGEKLQQAKEAVRQALRHLNQGDWLSLVTFSDQARSVLVPTPIGSKASELLDSTLGEIHAGGMTALCAGLELGLDLAGKEKRDTNLVLLLSDGQANVGVTDVEAVGQRGTLARQSGITVSTIGVGTDYNEALMAEIATQGGGRYYHLQSAGQIVPYLTGELGEAANLAVRDARIQLALPDGAVVVPLTAAYPAEQSPGRAVINVGDIPCDLELEVPLRLTLLGGQAGERLSVTGEVHYQSPAGRALSTGLNRVTVRFVEAKEFALREGVVLPVAERVARQMHAAQVLEVSRTMARDQREGLRKATTSREVLHEYVRLLGDEPSDRMMAELGEDYAAMAASPAAAKEAVSRSFGLQRSVRKHDKKK